MFVLWLSFSFVSLISTKTGPSIMMPYRIQGTVIFPNGTSVYADHELPSYPGNFDENLLFRGLFQLAGRVPMGPIILGDPKDGEAIRGSVLFPDGRRLRAHRKILHSSQTKLFPSDHDEHYLRNGSLGAYVFTINEEERLKTAGGTGGQVKVNLENDKRNAGNSYYLEKERLGAFVYSEGTEQGPSSASSQWGREEACRFSFTQPQGSRGQYWLLRSKPCGNLSRLTTTLPDGTNIHFYGDPVLVDL